MTIKLSNRIKLVKPSHPCAFRKGKQMGDAIST